MSERFRRVDNALIDHVFEPLANWIGQRSTFGAFRLARLCIDAAALSWIVCQLAPAAGAVGSGNLPIRVARFGLVVLGFMALSILRRVFERIEGAGGRANPLREGMHVHRVACLFWILGLLVKTAGDPPSTNSLALIAVGAFVTAAVYIGACSNPPPKRRNAERRWSRAGSFLFSTVAIR
jgi:hypothetical protein